MSYTAIGSLPLYLISAYSVRLQEELGFGPALYGLAISLYFATSSVVSPFVGRLVERVGPRVAMRGSATCAFAAILGIAGVANSWPYLAACLCLAAFANAFSQMAANVALASGVAPRRQGVSFGLKQAAVPIAGLVVGAWLPAVDGAMGWRTAALLLCTVPALAVWLVPRLAAPPPRGGAQGRGARALDRRLLALALAAALAGAVGNSLAVFVVDAAVTVGVGESFGAVLLAVGSGASITTRVAVGWFVDRKDRDGTVELIALMLGGAAGCALLIPSTASPALFVCGVLLAFTAGWGWPGLLYYHVVRTSPGSPGVASGIVVSGAFLGTIVGPSAIGTLVAHGSYSLAWTFCTIMITAGAGAMAYARSLLGRR